MRIFFISSLQGGYIISYFFSLSGTLAFRGASFGQGVGPIFLDQVACRGDEQRVLDCNSFLGVHMCDHTQDAGIRCIGTFISENTPVKKLLVKLAILMLICLISRKLHSNVVLDLRIHLCDR